MSLELDYTRNTGFYIIITSNLYTFLVVISYNLYKIKAWRIRQVIRQPRPRNNDDIAFHGIGEYLYFGTYRNDNGLTEEQEKWMKMYQNYISNFIRTGSPNDWTGTA